MEGSNLQESSACGGLHESEASTGAISRKSTENLLTASGTKKRKAEVTPKVSNDDSETEAHQAKLLQNPAVSSTHGTCAIETQFYKHSSLCLNSKKGSQMKTTDRT